METTNEHNEFENNEEVSSLLSKIPKQNNFKIPENYFENVQQEITDKINKSNPVKVIPISSKKTNTYFFIGLIAAAASIVLILFFNTTEKQTTLAKNTTPLEQNNPIPITVSMIEIAVEENLTQVDTLLIASFEEENKPITTLDNDFTIHELEDLFSDENFY